MKSGLIEDIRCNASKYFFINEFMLYLLLKFTIRKDSEKEASKLQFVILRHPYSGAKLSRVEEYGYVGRMVKSGRTGSF